MKILYVKSFYKNLEEKGQIVREFLKLHPKSTTREIKKKTSIKIERVYENGIKEAYKDAGLELPAHLKRRSAMENKQLVIDFIRKNPKTTISQIQKELRVNVFRLFGSIINAFNVAGVQYPERILNFGSTKKPKITVKKIKITNRRELKEIKKKHIMEALKNNPLLTQVELDTFFHTNISNLFGSFKNLCKEANVAYLRHQKRKLKKQHEVIEFIKNNPFATQWEINKYCKTHVQDIFEGGIREAFVKAGIEYSEMRRKIHGVATKDIKLRSSEFEKQIINILKSLGTVKTHVKTQHGIADAVLFTSNMTFVIEIKNYETKPITCSEIRQLDKYLTDLNCRHGLLICKRKNKGKNKFQMGSRKIMVITKEDILQGLSDSLV